MYIYIYMCVSQNHMDKCTRYYIIFYYIIIIIKHLDSNTRNYATLKLEYLPKKRNYLCMGKHKR